ncbi:hypothetical protein [Pedosphaera parvula]|nr:hypothetical protein [Pedosphaera parvula]
MKTKPFLLLTLLASISTAYAQDKVIRPNMIGHPDPTPIPPPANNGLAPVIMGINKGSVPDTVDLNWNSVSGQTYQLQFSSDFTNWLNLGPPVSGDGNLIVATQYTSNPQVFYRVLTY